MQSYGTGYTTRCSDEGFGQIYGEPFEEESEENPRQVLVLINLRDFRSLTWSVDLDSVLVSRLDSMQSTWRKRQDGVRDWIHTQTAK